MPNLRKAPPSSEGSGAHPVVRALEMEDYRQAILYAAIALESLARSELEAAYDNFVLSAAPPEYLNIADFVTPQGKVRKDPIFGMLTDSENFARLLHETPLYLWRRSLLLENEQLYRHAVNLYRTRNRLGHGKFVEPGSDLFQANPDGARNALKAALDVFAWFGHKGYAVPIYDQVPLYE